MIQSSRVRFQGPVQIRFIPKNVKYLYGVIRFRFGIHL